uniref:Uncharacterized protein n=1 Tax=Ixodes ricinus TaxID=34613 RepID=A0A6B0TWD1_IXORI
MELLLTSFFGLSHQLTMETTTLCHPIHFLKHELSLQRLNRLKAAGKFQILSWLNCWLSPTCTISNISIPLKRRYCI